MKLKDLLRKVQGYDKNANLSLIKKAYDFANEIHKDEKRASGEPYINHPLNVAFILAELKLDVNSIIAALLHDIVESNGVSIEKIKNEFNAEVANLVDALTKLTDIKIHEIRNAESIRKMLMASSKDLRVIIIKLADRLHNMRTVNYLPEEKIIRTCQETLDVYAPLAYKLGLANIKWELEDLSFKYLKPEIYQKFKNKFGKKRLQRELEVRKIKRLVEKKLKENNIEAEVIGRPKHFYSIYKKMITKKRSFEEIYDLIGLRIITKNISDCYKVLGIIHNLWKPIPGEFDDYIAMPKQNLYQSLHTAVIDKEQPIEFQIRTEEMDKISEGGVASHWLYKGIYGDKKFDQKLSWLREIIERDQDKTKEFMESLKVDLFEDEIYVFTPKGDVINLQKGSCPIDFAYAIHSSIGDKCIGAIVNGRIVPLRHELKNGDIIKILTSKKSTPKRDWLKIVKTEKAKIKIRHFIKAYQKIPPTSIKREEIKKNLIEIKNERNYSLRYAKCCSPIPDDKITAYKTKTNEFTIHKNDCRTLSLKKKEKKFKANWIEINNMPVTLMINANDRVGLFADILNTVAATGTNVDPAKAKHIGNNIVECSLGIIAESIDHIKDLLSRINRVKSVNKVYIE